MFLLHPADVRSTLAAAATACYHSSIPPWRGGRRERRAAYRPISARADPSRRPLSASLEAASAAAMREEKKPAVCTADELHYVPVPGTEWRLALWRYTPSPEAPPRNHPLMLLSGVGTNAIGFDLSPGVSFARHMSSQGFDTWIVEVRGAGLGTRVTESKAIGQSSSKPVICNNDSINKYNSNVDMPIEEYSIVKTGSMPDTEISITNGNKTDVVPWDESQLVTKLTATLMHLAERLSGYVNEGQLRVVSAKFFDRISKLLEDARLSERFNEITDKISSLLEARQNSSVAGQIRDLSQRLVNIIEEGQRSVSPQLFDLQERLSATIEDFQKQLDLIVTYDWDFDHYLEEDVPAAVRWNI